MEKLPDVRILFSYFLVIFAALVVVEDQHVLVDQQVFDLWKHVGLFYSAREQEVPRENPFLSVARLLLVDIVHPLVGFAS